MTESRQGARAKIDFARFRALAPGAIAAHNPAFYVDETSLAVGRIVGGGLPLVGMLFWDWSAGQMLALLLIGYWVGIAVDTITLAMLAQTIKAEAAQRGDTQYVWSVVEALQKGSDEYNTSYSAPYSPVTALALDIVLGLIGSGMLWMSLRDTETPIQFFHPGRPYMVSVVIIVGMAMARLTALVVRKRQRFGARKTGFAAGGRGVGLLILGFAVVFAGEAATPQVVVAIADGGLVLLGAMGIAGLGIILSETAWLRDYVARPSST
ncbi:MAG: hypothetical protein P4L92_04505 [Rudaea sp.]|nr:hypothetical protein [Rudaea sp.]